MDEDSTEVFRRKTVTAIGRCADYLRDHADELADSFAEGCKSWSITFSAGIDGYFPWVEVHTSAEHVDAIEAYETESKTF